MPVASAVAKAFSLDTDLFELGQEGFLRIRRMASIKFEQLRTTRERWKGILPGLSPCQPPGRFA
jgi:hypothetical protein